MTIENSTTRVDGRTRRRRRNVDAVVDAVIELADQGNLDPTSEEIAAVAGVSHRSIYRYFENRADLLDAAVLRAFESVAAEVLGRAEPDESFDERIERFVSARVAMYCRLRSIARVATTHRTNTASGLEQARATLRHELANTFAAEFDRMAPAERPLALAAIDAAFQFEALEYLSNNAGLDEVAVRESLARHLRCHFATAETQPLR